MSVYTVWYKCALCGYDLAEVRDIEAREPETALILAPAQLIHEGCEGSPEYRGIGVCRPVRVVE